MQRNAAIQLFVIFVAVLLGIAILFWPDDEDEKDGEELIEITLNSIKIWLIAIVTFPVIVYRKLKISKHRALYITGFSLVLILLLLPIFITSITPINDTPEGIGVKEINSSRTIIYDETFQDQNLTYSFTQVEITIYDNDGLWNRIKGFTLDAYTEKNNPSTLISTTKWSSFRDFKGIITIGASLVIDAQNIPAINTSIYLVVTLEWVEFFSEKSRQYDHEILYGI
jgi:hypothetical protein